MSDTSGTAESPSPFRRFVKYAFFGIVALILLGLLAAGVLLLATRKSRAAAGALS